MLQKVNNGLSDSTYNVMWPIYVKSLPKTLDRFRTASVFFDLDFPPFLKASIDARKWISWASISALISVKEVLEIDLENLGFVEKWKNSEEFAKIRSNEVLLMLKELRNYEIHIEFEKRISHTEIDKGNVGEYIDHDSFFFSPIEWSRISRLRNIRSGRSHLTEEIVTRFNEQYARKYSVEAIILSTMDWYAINIHSFLIKVKNDDG